MTPWQCRDARNLLKWSQEDFGRDAGLPAEIVAMFEDGTLVGMLDCQDAMRNMLEALGIAFPF